ncbi:DUF3592 domain-containing protein [Actinokineospora enzanensis]|uniref:DUF3592 domain-containing protein n=1 Tax=Actinokineospora enzanensis TaxID=155975 RepID=UPI0003701A4D|nr:DUF3592 domain-containing protein [Actinokineospora enzanensis]
MEARLADVRRLSLHTAIISPWQLPLPARDFTSMAPEVATRAVRRLRTRALVLVLLGVVSAAAFVVASVLLDDRYTGLREHGVAVPGVVVSVYTTNHTDKMSVRFPVDGVDRVRELSLDDQEPAVGDQVTIYYDPADPDRLAAGITANMPGWQLGLLAGALGAFVLLTTVGSISLTRWARRARAVRRHGWWPGTARPHPDWPRILEVRFDDWPDTVLHLTPGYSAGDSLTDELRTGPVLIGGTGRRITIVYLRGPMLQAAREWP